jgi:6-phosphofructokinase 1
MPRGYVGMINETDSREAFDAGAFAVEAADRGGGSVALQVENGRTVLKLVPLGNVAGKTRHMPDGFLDPDANRLSAEGLAYFERLLPRKFEVGKPFV